MFITFEGGEGVSKSTQANLLYQYFISKNMPAMLTREPGGTPFGEGLRKVALSMTIQPMTELLAMMSARCEHIAKVIKPALAEGIIVICDRFVDSTACYQTINGHISMDLVYQLHQQLLDNFLPDVTIFLDLPPEIALPRARARSAGTIDKNEAQDLAYHQKIYQSYHQLAQLYHKRIKKVNANGEKQEIHHLIMQIVAQ
jgi:dTMP kinase